MRVIAGKYKGRTLIAPKGDTRPTLDRTKETLFNILNFRLQGAVVLDLFAGSGQLAIESISRGAARAVLCDNSRDAVTAIRTNYAKIGESPDINICSYQSYLTRCNIRFDVIFVDPPYKSGYYVDVLRKIAEYGLLNEGGVVVCEHSAEDFIEDVDGLNVYDCRKIGAVKFSFYQRSEECE